MAWSGTMPTPQYPTVDGRPPKRSTLVADVVDVWNSSFFRARGVEAVLYKGRERRSGRYAGTIDTNLPPLDPLDVSSPSASEDDSEEEPEEEEQEGVRRRCRCARCWSEGETHQAQSAEASERCSSGAGREVRYVMSSAQVSG